MAAGFRSEAGSIRASSAVVCRYQRKGEARPADVWSRYRNRVRRSVGGSVLEIGACDATELARYQHVRFLALVGASRAVRAQERTLEASAVEVAEAGLEDLPFPQQAFDVVVCNFSLCSAVEPDRAALELNRVLRRNGQLLFLEHTRAPGVVGKAQDRVSTMLWGSGLCRPNLEVLPTVQRAGLVVWNAEWFWLPALVHAPLVYGIATHPDDRHDRELRWLRGW